MAKNVCFYTLGCKVNQYETQVMREQFQEKGYNETGIEDANVAVINTCTVTFKSDVKSYNLIRKAIRKSPANCIVIVTGCLVKFDKDKIQKIKGVDLVLENEFKPLIGKIVEHNFNKINISPCVQLNSGISYFKNHTRAFLKVQDGCPHSCTYCRITLARGVPRSKKPEDVLNEVRTLVNNRYKEIVLTGVCLGAYGLDLKEGYNIEKLLKFILQNLKGEFRIRLSSIEPNYITESLLDYIIDNERICSHLHIPIQSGDDKILKLMNRPYDSEWVLKFVRYAKAQNPQFAFSTDIIIGFPGETNFSVENTISLLKSIQPVRTHIFHFSRRKNTKAYEFKTDVSDYDMKRWYKKIIEVSDNMSKKYKLKFFKKEIDVLIEKAEDSSFEGYSDSYIYAKGNGANAKVNSFIKIRVKKITPESVIGIRV